MERSLLIEFDDPEAVHITHVSGDTVTMWPMTTWLCSRPRTSWEWAPAILSIILPFNECVSIIFFSLSTTMTWSDGVCRPTKQEKLTLCIFADWHTTMYLFAWSWNIITCPRVSATKNASPEMLNLTSTGTYGLFLSLRSMRANKPSCSILEGIVYVRELTCDWRRYKKSALMVDNSEEIYHF